MLPLTFTITTDDQKKINKWLEELKPRIIEKQKSLVWSLGPAAYNTLTNNGTEPYYGAIAGNLTYKFIQSGIGVLKIVKEAITGEELSLTDFESL